MLACKPIFNLEGKSLVAMHWTASVLEPESFLANHPFVVSLYPDTDPDVIFAEHKKIVADAVLMVRSLNRHPSIEMVSSIVDLPHWNVERCLRALGILEAGAETNGVHKEKKKKRDAHVTESERVVKILLECLVDGPKSVSALVQATGKNADYVQCQLRRRRGELWERIRNTEKRPPKVTSWSYYLWEKI